ncbi:TPA: hypothetical protein F8R87_00755 [Legionella pneumophila]|uniref:hypothetical protein n=1 Tax=Legionella pneumophila TaxID=446 RepID=UPI001374E102|nr:hypothetical protein [Legionella pneumophila]HAU1248349.1 hypothetical protein [Legionella pneumophila]HBB6897388.1 hypothetical protein [Legionella pneumophila]
MASLVTNIRVASGAVYDNRRLKFIKIMRIWGIYKPKKKTIRQEKTEPQPFYLTYCEYEIWAIQAMLALAYVEIHHSH